MGKSAPLWVPYYFCLVNLAAAIAVLSVLGGVRFERWNPTREAGEPASPPEPGGG